MATKKKTTKEVGGHGCAVKSRKQSPKKRETKFNVSKDTSGRTYDGIVFDSVVEMEYYRDVILPFFTRGLIKRYELQKPYELQPKFRHDGKTIRPIVYVADFYVEYTDGRIEVIDTKGHPDAKAEMKRKMFWYHYPDITYRWICYSRPDGGWCDYEYVQKERAKRRKEREAKKAAQEAANKND